MHALAERVAARRADAGPDDVDALMGHVDDGLGPAALPHAVVARPASTTASQAALDPVPRLAPRRPARAARHRGAVPDRASSCPTASGSRSSGYADRLELDADGRVVVVDLKTGRDHAERAAVAAPPSSSALYQYAVDHGAVDGLDRGRRRAAAAGGAELVQLGLARRRPDAVVQPQPAQRRRRPGARRRLRDELGRAAAPGARRGVPGRRRATTAATAPSCRICPVKSAGSVVAQ